jgi:hypothetical protein
VAPRFRYQYKSNFQNLFCFPVSFGLHRIVHSRITAAAAAAWFPQRARLFVSKGVISRLQPRIMSSWVDACNHAAGKPLHTVLDSFHVCGALLVCQPPPPPPSPPLPPLLPPPPHFHFFVSIYCEHQPAHLLTFNSSTRRSPLTA